MNIRILYAHGPLALVVLSGGQDSATCLALAMHHYGREQVRAITFDYGQRHKVEIESAQRIAAIADLKDQHEVIRIGEGILHGSSPLVNKSAQVEAYENAQVLPGGLEKTFVPMRNQLFLTIAYNRAVVWGMEKRLDVDVITGVSEEDYGGYPDCRASFISALARAGDESLDSPELPQIHIVTPLMYKNKRETVDLSESIPGAREMLAWSHTCYNGQIPPCGHCHACLLRARGYDQAGVLDPLLERLADQGAR